MASFVLFPQAAEAATRRVLWRHAGGAQFVASIGGDLNIRLSLAHQPQDFSQDFRFAGLFVLELRDDLGSLGRRQRAAAACHHR